jgi:hypothetical protein
MLRTSDSAIVRPVEDENEVRAFQTSKSSFLKHGSTIGKNSRTEILERWREKCPKEKFDNGPTSRYKLIQWGKMNKGNHEVNFIIIIIVL